jgi:ABC-type dipeptide/oligopeptide/nickel transport system permease component
MLKEALRRLLWLGPTLIIVTIPTFWAISRSMDRVRGNAPEGVPLFFNANPLDVRERALVAVAKIAKGGAETSAATEKLNRLGGAALPHVLSQLDSLRPEERGRVALALVPVARRMGVGSNELDSPEAAVLFFSHYWEEHAIDFRPSVVHRTVQRFAERPSPLRRSEVLELDTLALEDLLDAMHSLARAGDVDRLRQVCDVAAHIVGERTENRAFSVGKVTSLAAARKVEKRWESFWRRRRSEYMTFSGTRRLGATIAETRYGRWLERVFTSVSDPSGPEAGGLAEGADESASHLLGRGKVTLLLVLVSLLVGQPLSVLAGAYAAIRRHAAGNAGTFSSALAVAGAVGFGALIAWIATPAHGRHLAGAVAMTALVSAALALRQHRTVQRYINERLHLRTELAFGASPSRILRNNLRLTAALAFVLAMTDLPALVTTAFAAERVFALHGLGDATAEAARRGDASFLMALALVGAATLGLSQIAADVVLKALDPRVSGVVSRAGEIFR